MKEYKDSVWGKNLRPDGRLGLDQGPLQLICRDGFADQYLSFLNDEFCQKRK